MIKSFLHIGIILTLAASTTSDRQLSSSPLDRDCSTLLPGQYICLEPRIDSETQRPANCSSTKYTLSVPCLPAPGIICNKQIFNGSEIGFYQTLPCIWTNGFKFDVALLLSIFGGFLGLDRFYLGYPAFGCLKLFTVGFLGFGQLVDIILIALQVLGPADGSAYVYPFFGPGVNRQLRTNDTYLYFGG